MKSLISKQYINYYDEFSCTGSDCSINCCHTWRIDIDDTTVQKYEELDNKYGLNISSQIIPKDKDSLAYIKLKEDGQCPFLNGKGLCELVCSHGDNFLSQACQTFPRLKIERIFYDIEYYVMELGCPEVVKKAILNTRKLAFEADKGNASKHSIPLKTISEGSDLTEKTKEINHKINNVFVQLIQLESVSIEKRLTAGLLFCSRIDETDARNNYQEALSIYNDMLSAISTKLANIPELRKDRARQFETLNNILENLIATIAQTNETPLRTATFNLVKGHYNGLGVSSFDCIEEQHCQNYINAYEKYTAPFLRENPHITENFFAHYWLASLFPFDGSQNTKAVSRFLRLAAMYMLIIGLTTGNAAKKDSIDGELLADTIAIFYRTLSRNEAAMEFVEKICEVYEIQSVDDIYAMVV